jgi:hypothetical protein
VFFCGSETLSLKKREWNTIQAAELTNANQLWAEDIRHQLCIFHLHGYFKEYEGE